MAVAAIAISAINGAKAVVHACQSAKTLQRVLEGRKHKNGQTRGRCTELLLQMLETYPRCCHRLPSLF